MVRPRSREYELAVIGAGIAGMAAALFAANRGLSVMQAGATGGIAFASGFLDLLGVHPVEEGRGWLDPWAGIERLRTDMPRHPLARVEPEDIRAAFQEFLGFLEKVGLPYRFLTTGNVEVITLLGTVKPTYALPATMWNGVEALREKRPCLFLDFEGLLEFNANLLVGNLKARWPHIRSARLVFPGTGATTRLFTRHLAQQLELEENQESLARLIRSHLRHGECVAMPAILGMSGSREVLSRMEELIQAPLFEIPTLPAAVPGLRLKETFEAHLPARGVQTFWQRKVSWAGRGGDNSFRLRLGEGAAAEEIHAEAVVLATGRFFGKGLVADRARVRESLFDLPVSQPEARSHWHHQDFWDPRGHPVNRAGLETDDRFRPLALSGQPAYPSLYASGSILAHQDWMRMKCGSGSAIATSYAVVKAISERKRVKRP